MWSKIRFRAQVPLKTAEDLIVKACMRYGRENVDVFGQRASGSYSTHWFYIKEKYAILFIIEHSEHVVLMEE